MNGYSIRMAASTFERHVLICVVIVSLLSKVIPRYFNSSVHGTSEPQIVNGVIGSCLVVRLVKPVSVVLLVLTLIFHLL